LIVKRKENYERSVLSKYVEFTGFARDTATVSKGTEAIKLLFKNKAKLQYCDGAILFWPVAQGHYSVVKLLLEHGANATFWPKDALGHDYNFTPIEQAIASGHDDIVNLLVEHGARKPSKKQTIQLRLIEAASHGTISELKELLEKGGNINSRNINGETVLINVLSTPIYDYETYMKIVFLLDSGADPNLTGDGLILKDSLPLNQAILNSSFLFKAKNRDTSYAKQIIQRLIKKGAYISGIDNDGRTPLHIAAKYNNLYAAQLLLNSGSKVMPRNKQGKTPLDYAQSAEMIKLLKNHGAIEQ